MKHVPLAKILWQAAIAVWLLAGSVAGQQPATGSSETPALGTSVSKSRVQVAEPFVLEIRCLAPAGARVFFPAVIGKLGEFDVLDHRDRFDVPEAAASGLRSWTRTMTLESIVTGEQTLPRIEVQVATAAGTTQLLSDAVPVRVLSVLEDRPDPANFRDVKPLVDLEVPGRKSLAWVGWTVAGLAATAMLLGGLILVARRRRWLTPAQWASREFNRLEATYPPSGPNGPDRAAAAHDLASVIREFLELQLEIPAMTRTTGELLAGIRASGGVDEDSLAGIGELFRLADQARYAGLRLSARQWQDAVHTGRRLVGQIARQAALPRSAGSDAADGTSGPAAGTSNENVPGKR